MTNTKNTIQELWAKGFSVAYIRLLMDMDKVEDPSAVLMVDPPMGWMYGFPKPVDESKTIREMLIEAGYPSSLISPALEHLRFFKTHPKR